MVETITDISYIEFNERIDFWWKSKPYLDWLIEILANSGIHPLKYLSYRDEIFEVTSHPQLLDIIKNSEDVSLSFDLMEKIDAPNYTSFSLSKDTIGIQILLNAHKVEILDRIRNVVWDVISAFEPFSKFGPMLAISFRNQEFPRIRPPRDYQGLGADTITNFIQLKYFNQFPERGPRGIEKLVDNNLLQGASKKLQGSVCEVNWVNDFSSDETINEALIAREKWIYENLDIKVLEDWNEFGDRSLYHISALDKLSGGADFFSYYHFRRQIAFKLFVLDEQGGIDNETRDIVETKLNNGKLSDGSPIKKVVFVTPSRESAFAIQSTAELIGISKVVYIDDDGILWDMAPEGNYLN